MQGIKPSEAEKKSIGDLVELFSESILEASKRGDNLLSKLEESFLSVDDATIMMLRRKQDELLSAMWKLNINLCEMHKFPERIIGHQNASEVSD